MGIRIPLGKWAVGLRSFFAQSRRVWQITRKPTMDEFKTVAKVSALGISIIGLLGFVISVLWKPIGF